MSALFGWDLLYGSVITDVKNNADVLMCFTHYVLISNGFSCIGIGDDKVLDENEQKSEKLPPGWNSGHTLRYVYEGRLYHLKGTLVEDTVQFNLIRVDERNASVVSLNLRTVLNRNGTVAEMIPNYTDIIDTLKKQLIDPVIISKKNKTQETQTSTGTTDDQPSSTSGRFYGIPANPMSQQQSPFSSLIEPPFVGVGRRDLDPFFDSNPLGLNNRGGVRDEFGFGSGGGGGMLFPSPGSGRPLFGDPIRGGGGLLRGRVPPGARFDPFMPPDPDGNQRPSRNPGSDDFPPPEFGNMFM